MGMDWIVCPECEDTVLATRLPDPQSYDYQISLHDGRGGGSCTASLNKLTEDEVEFA